VNALILQHSGTHEFEAISLRLVDILSDMGVHSNILTIEAYADSHAEVFDLLLVNLGSTAPTGALQTAVQQGESWQSRALDRIMQHTQSGGSCLILHIAIVAFEMDVRWKSLVGGSWKWGTSFHQPIGSAMICPTNDPIVRDMLAFSAVDEIYECLSLEPELRVLATVPEHGNAPVVWVRDQNGSRLAYSALGHRPESYDAESFRSLILKLLSWLCGRLGTIDINTPRP